MYSVTKTFAENFWKNVAISEPDNCWFWLKGKNSRGYGVVHVPGQGTVAVTRIAYFLAKGAFNPDHCMMHLCETPSCCNPNHLQPGTMSENLRFAYRAERINNSITAYLKAKKQSLYWEKQAKRWKEADSLKLSRPRRNRTKQAKLCIRANPLTSPTTLEEFNQTLLRSI